MGLYHMTNILNLIHIWTSLRLIKPIYPSLTRTYQSSQIDTPNKVKLE
jgi:hypothetical protein